MKNITLKWGFLAAAALTVYFFLMKFAGLVHILELRYLNAFIMLGGVWLAVKSFKEKQADFNYFSGLTVGIVTGFIATSIFALFSFLYVTVLDPSFMIAIQQNDLMGEYMNEYLVPVQIFIEGVTSTFLFSYIVMQRLKISRTAALQQKLNRKAGKTVKHQRIADS